MTKDEELLEFGELIRMSELLLSSHGYKEILHIIVKESAVLLECHRVCLVIKNRKGELIIKDGFPFNEHGIGEKIGKNNGFDLLNEAMEKKSHTLINDPLINPKTLYMKELIRKRNISAVLFEPLFYKSEKLGVLIFDAIENKFSKKVIQKARLLANLASTAIGGHYEKKADQQKMLEMERLSAVGANSERIAHTVRNKMMEIGAFARRIENITPLIKENPSDELKLKKVEKYSKIISSQITQLERIVNDVLAFASSKSLRVKLVNMNEFIREEINLIKPYCKEKGVSLKFLPDKRLNRVHICLDGFQLANCIKDIVSNAVNFFAKRITILSYLKSKDRMVVVSILNDGEIIDPGIINDIFSPFITTRTDGTGLGLANAKKIINSHGGDIKVLSSGRKTEFKIFLPLGCRLASKLRL